MSWEDSVTPQSLNEFYKKKPLIEFDGQGFDSNWEVYFYKKCLENGLNVTREPKVIKWSHRGKTHFYVPDFEVDGKLVEIKGSQFFDKNGKFRNPYDKRQTKMCEAKWNCMVENNVIVLKSIREIDAFFY